MIVGVLHFVTRRPGQAFGLPNHYTTTEDSLLLRASNPLLFCGQLFFTELFDIPHTFIIVEAKVNSTVREAASTRVVMMGLAIRAGSR